MSLIRTLLGLTLAATLVVGCGDDGEAPPSDICGDGVCDISEDNLSCGEDCPFVGCGDGVCDDSEDLATCPADCSAASPLDGKVWANCEVDHDNPLVACAIGTTDDRLAVDGDDALTYDASTGACTRWSITPHASEFTIATCTSSGVADEITNYQDQRYIPSFTEGWLSLVGRSRILHYGEAMGETAASVEAQCTSLTEANCPPFNPYDPVDPAITGEWQYCVDGNGPDPTTACGGTNIISVLDGTDVMLETDITNPMIGHCLYQYVAADLGGSSHLAFGDCVTHGRRYSVHHDAFLTVAAETYLSWPRGDGGYQHMVKVPDGSNFGCGSGVITDLTCP